LIQNIAQKDIAAQGNHGPSPVSGHVLKPLIGVINYREGSINSKEK
jgi:hypothetical protein